MSPVKSLTIACVMFALLIALIVLLILFPGAGIGGPREGDRGSTAAGDSASGQPSTEPAQSKAAETKHAPNTAVAPGGDARPPIAPPPASAPAGKGEAALVPQAQATDEHENGTSKPEPAVTAKTEPEATPRAAQDDETSSPAQEPAAMTAETGPEALQGTVLDDETSTPVAGARVKLHIGESGWQGDTTDENGAFHYKPKEDIHRYAQLRDGMPDEERKEHIGEQLRSPLALSVQAKGYKTWDGVPSGATTIVRLERDREGHLPGTVFGRILNSDGRPFVGAAVVAQHDPMFQLRSYQWVTTDDDGNYTAPGVTCGEIEVGLGSDLQKVSVPEGGSVRADFTVPPEGLDSRGEKFSATTRAVIVVDLPVDAPNLGAVRAQAQYGSFFRVPVEGGVARFDRLPIGSWRFVLEQPGHPDVFRDDVVGRGDDPFSVSFK